MAAAAMAFCLLGCQGSDQTTPAEDTTSVEQATTTVARTTAVPEPVLTAEEKVLRWIRSCEVRLIVFTRRGTFVDFRGGNGSVRLRIPMRAEQRLMKAAWERECEKRIVVGME